MAFDSLAVLVLAEECKKGLQQHEGEPHEMHNNIVMMEKNKYLYPHIFNFIEYYMILLPKHSNNDPCSTNDYWQQGS